jgi:citrate synthase
MHGELPDATERAQFRALLRSHRLCHEHLIRFYRGACVVAQCGACLTLVPVAGFKTDAPPMAMLVAVVGALSSFYPDSTDVTDPARRELACVRVIAKLPVLAALAFKTSIGQPAVYARDDLGYAENLLYMMFAVPTRPWMVDPVAAHALETILILHLDHEQNASTSTVRIAGSSQANPFACVASGIASLWGPAHGGANEAVVKMLEEIGTVDRIPAFLARAKDKSSAVRLMGFGHRVYRAEDPRARVLRRTASELDAPRYEVAQALEAAKAVLVLTDRGKKIHEAIDAMPDAALDDLLADLVRPDPGPDMPPGMH